MTLEKFGRYALGTLIAGLFVGASAAIDISTAAGLSSEPLERYILVAVAAGAVAWKTCALAAVARLWRERRWPLSVACSLLLVVAIGISASFEMRLYSKLFHDGAEARSDIARQRAGLKGDIRRIEAALEAAGSETRSLEEIDARISWRLAIVIVGDARKRTVGQATADCRNAASPHFAANCSEVAQLRIVEAQLGAVPRLRAERDAAVEKLRSLKAVAGSDALAEAIGALTGVRQEVVLATLAAAIMLMIQTGSVVLPAAFFGGASPEQPGSGGGRKRRDEGSAEPTNDRTTDSHGATNIVELKRPGTTASGASAASDGAQMVGRGATNIGSGGTTNRGAGTSNFASPANEPDELPMPDDPMSDPDRLWIDDPSLGAFGDERDVAVGEFVRGHVTAKRGASISASDLFASWQAVGDPDIAPGMTPRCFGRRLTAALRAAGIASRRTRSGSRGATMYSGLQLSDAARAAIGPEARRGALRVIAAPQAPVPQAANA